MFGYVYKTTNLVNGKIYIGQHKSTAFDDTYYGSGYILKEALQKYGKENFSIDVLEWCSNRDILDEREIYWITQYNTTDKYVGYNISNGGHTTRFFGDNHPMYGKHHTATSKYKNKLSHIGKKHSAETRNKMSVNNAWKGKHLSEDHKHKISLANKGKVHPAFSDEARAKIGQANKGKVMSEEVKQKLRNSHLGKKLSKETRDKLSISHRGQKGYWAGKQRDVNTKIKISKSLIGKKNIKRRSVFSVDGIIFTGLEEGAIYFGITKSCMSLWVIRGYTKDNRTITRMN